MYSSFLTECFNHSVTRIENQSFARNLLLQKRGTKGAKNLSHLRKIIEKIYFMCYNQ
ncbi:hypothetical protein HMPREF9163_00724 [Selenomonas sp. oral taxon 138 str. F0429]|nr:hypothetical protein HMPREF9163_00724 [Selenomonas sp. oral taxon 138 str. F0429]